MLLSSRLSQGILGTFFGAPHEGVKAAASGAAAAPPTLKVRQVFSKSRKVPGRQCTQGPSILKNPRWLETS
jgi:hypothetical protein